MTYRERRYCCGACGQPHRLTKWDHDPVPPCPGCGQESLEDLSTRGNLAPTVIGDECDVTIAHGICNPDGSPRRYTSKSEMRQVAKALGLVNVVRHQPLPGSDKSPFTTRHV